MVIIWSYDNFKILYECTLRNSNETSSLVEALRDNRHHQFFCKTLLIAPDGFSNEMVLQCLGFTNFLSLGGNRVAIRVNKIGTPFEEWVKTARTKLSFSRFPDVATSKKHFGSDYKKTKTWTPRAKSSILRK